MTTASLILMSSLLVAMPEKFADLFQAREYRYTGGQYKQAIFRYRLFVPHPLQPAKRYPLLVWLHALLLRLWLLLYTRLLLLHTLLLLLHTLFLLLLCLSLLRARGRLCLLLSSALLRALLRVLLLLSPLPI